jgi:hypothetical protein
MIANNIDTFACQQQFFSATQHSIAACLEPTERKMLSLQVLAKTQPLTRLAQDYQVSRKFLYQQAAKARQALDGTFRPSPKDKNVIYHLPITKDWIRQFVLAQILIGHSSYRAVMEILYSIFDYQDISIGTIHNIVNHALQKARRVNQTEPLSAIRIGAHDEIYQCGKPVLVGMDVESTYCYLRAAEDHCDETTWGVHLLDLNEQGLCLDYTIADGGKGLRSGQRAAWGRDIPCHGDVFHAQATLNELALFLERRAASCTSVREKMEWKMEKLKRSSDGRNLSNKLALARKVETKAVSLANDVRILVDWMHNDILSLSGPDLSERQQLYDFVVEELTKRKLLCPHRISPVCKMLKNHRVNLLAFAEVLDDKFDEIAARFKVPVFLVHALCELQGLDRNEAFYWQRRGLLQNKLKNKFTVIETAVKQAMSETPRASSIVENLNSRLRNYFFLRRHIGNDYLHLLRFFLNHRRFERSERPERVRKSPVELLTGKRHSHWLELLGFERFSRN